MREPTAVVILGIHENVCDIATKRWQEIPQIRPENRKKYFGMRTWGKNPSSYSRKTIKELPSVEQSSLSNETIAG
jgi:hypothetical protein